MILPLVKLKKLVLTWNDAKSKLWRLTVASISVTRVQKAQNWGYQPLDGAEGQKSP